MEPFQNEADVTSIGQLTIENRTDRISISGSLDITRDKAGLQNARALKQLFDEIVTVLGREDLPDAIKLSETKAVKNPFR